MYHLRLSGDGRSSRADAISWQSRLMPHRNSWWLYSRRRMRNSAHAGWASRELAHCASGVRTSQFPTVGWMRWQGVFRRHQHVASLLVWLKWGILEQMGSIAHPKANSRLPRHDIMCKIFGHGGGRAVRGDYGYTTIHFVETSQTRQREQRWLSRNRCL